MEKSNKWTRQSQEMWIFNTIKIMLERNLNSLHVTQPVRPVEYTLCNSAEGNPSNECPLAQFLGLQNTPTASLQRSKTPNECPAYGAKQSDGDASVILELRGMWSTASFPSLPGPL